MMHMSLQTLLCDNQPVCQPPSVPQNVPPANMPPSLSMGMCRSFAWNTCMYGKGFTAQNL